jgi:hypothetical protein
MSKNNVMPGFMLNAVGHYVPESMVAPIDKQRDQLVKELLSKATIVNSSLVEFKNIAFADIAAFIELSAEEYNTKVGGKKATSLCIALTVSTKCSLPLLRKSSLTNACRPQRL